MIGWSELDRVLRGDSTPIALPPLLWINILLAGFYGVCIGVFGLFRPDGTEWRQMIAAAVKVPALFGLTLAVTFPSLYVFNTLLGSRLRIADLARLVVQGLSVMCAVLAAFGPITAFFSVTTSIYPFILLLNVAVFGLAGLLGLGFLEKLSRRFLVNDGAAGEAGGGLSRKLFTIWMGMTSLVAAQMGWVLRPFVGSPDLPFAWFRDRDGSFFHGVARSLQMLLFETVAR